MSWCNQMNIKCKPCWRIINKFTTKNESNYHTICTSTALIKSSCHQFILRQYFSRRLIQWMQGKGNKELFLKCTWMHQSKLKRSECLFQRKSNDTSWRARVMRTWTRRTCHRSRSNLMSPIMQNHCWRRIWRSCRLMSIRRRHHCLLWWIEIKSWSRAPVLWWDLRNYQRIP